MFKFTVIEFFLFCSPILEARFIGKNIERPSGFTSKTSESSNQKEQPNIENNLLQPSSVEDDLPEGSVLNVLGGSRAITKTQSQQSIKDSNTRPEDGNEKSNIETPYGEYSVEKRFLFLNIKLTLNVDMEGGSRRRYEVTVPVGHVISVFEAFVEAAASLRSTYTNAENPFNMGLQYNEEGTCLHIIRAFGLEVDDDHVWRIDIKKRGGQSLYSGVCVPGRYDIRVGPFYEIDLTYSHINSARI